MRPQRKHLIAYRSAVVTDDTAQALRALEANLASRAPGVRLLFSGVPSRDTQWDPWDGGGPLRSPPHLSMRPTGREVYLDLQLPDEASMDPQAASERKLALLWGFAIPLGFTPWNRFPVPGEHDKVYHFYGPWQSLLDHLASDGRGETAWSSLCAAAQSDVGTWMGSHRVERFVQAQLHRVGLHSGPVDGVIGEQTTAAIRALGYHTTLVDTAKALTQLQDPVPPKRDRRTGHIILPGDDVTLLTYGRVTSIKTRQGYTLSVDGSGKVILNIGNEV